MVEIFTNSSASILVSQIKVKNISIIRSVTNDYTFIPTLYLSLFRTYNSSSNSYEDPHYKRELNLPRYLATNPTDPADHGRCFPQQGRVRLQRVRQTCVRPLCGQLAPRYNIYLGDGTPRRGPGNNISQYLKKKSIPTTGTRPRADRRRPRKHRSRTCVTAEAARRLFRGVPIERGT
ncbi:hypothetical protein EVAR_39238_1 [Eumeta japonica]|uniref:Uncharacterized protein n=1 Tax=Eumeta variegata TaxID=151549 RepID=A0A4C1Y3D1_EUMVA|nr:hypothetical protein EVAR_39238_1 [Eumeta japonica]